MDTQTGFRAVVGPILDRYRETSLISRWKEATVSDPDPKPLAFWIRESDDLVNMVWLMRHEIRDITWYPKRDMSTFNLLRYSAVTGIEVREATGIAKQVGLDISGDYMVDVRAISQHGGLIWVASNEKEAAELGQFVNQFLGILMEG